MESALGQATLIGRAVLPAETFAPGPTSGRLLGERVVHGIRPPFVDKQPVQGFSAILPNPDGTFVALADNGFGQMENSADFLLRLYMVRPDFKTGPDQGSGTVTVLRHISLRDPLHRIPFPITNEFTQERLLTGADLDLESMQRAPDGTFWFGDEFGPFLIHAGDDGKVLEAPIPLPDLDREGRSLESPENPRQPPAALVRVMNAMAAHARAHGGARPPVCSPSVQLVPAIDLAQLRAAGHRVVVWTVNERGRMLDLLRKGVDGIITDRPDLLREAVAQFDANGDGKPGDYLDADGLIDRSRFDAQGHRGARHLRPESTLPAFEAALDELMTTLELDCGVSADGVAVVRHDEYIEPFCARRADGAPYTRANQVLLRQLPLARIERDFIADRLLPGIATQRNDLPLSPVSAAFAAAKGMPHVYGICSLERVLDFVPFYADYHERGAGKDHPQAARRAANARSVHWNIETKLDPRPDRAGLAAPPEDFVDAIARPIVVRKLEERVEVQSFDFRTLRICQRKYPRLGTVCLVDAATLMSGPEGSPWLAGMHFPPLANGRDRPRVQTSGGIEGMAISTDGLTLLPILEKPLLDSASGVTSILVFDLAQRRFLRTRYRYPMDPNGQSVGEFIMTSPSRGLVLERDDRQGDLRGIKAVFEVTLSDPERPVEKRLVVDLLSIRDPNKISYPLVVGDVGLGENFAFPFWTIESICALGPDRILVVNDNNFPLSMGRHLGSDRPDDTEFILLKLARPIDYAPHARR